MGISTSSEITAEAVDRARVTKLVEAGAGSASAMGAGYEARFASRPRIVRCIDQWAHHLARFVKASRAEWFYSLPSDTEYMQRVVASFDGTIKGVMRPLWELAFGNLDDVVCRVRQRLTVLLTTYDVFSDDTIRGVLRRAITDSNACSKPLSRDSPVAEVLAAGRTGLLNGEDVDIVLKARFVWAAMPEEAVAMIQAHPTVPTSTITPQHAFVRAAYELDAAKRLPPGFILMFVAKARHTPTGVALAKLFPELTPDVGTIGAKAAGEQMALRVTLYACPALYPYARCVLKESTDALVNSIGPMMRMLADDTDNRGLNFMLKSGLKELKQSKAPRYTQQYVLRTPEELETDKVRILLLFLQSYDPKDRVLPHYSLHDKLCGRIHKRALDQMRTPENRAMYQELWVKLLLTYHDMGRTVEAAVQVVDMCIANDCCEDGGVLAATLGNAIGQGRWLKADTDHYTKFVTAMWPKLRESPKARAVMRNVWFCALFACDPENLDEFARFLACLIELSPCMSACDIERIAAFGLADGVTSLVGADLSPETLLAQKARWKMVFTVALARPYKGALPEGVASSAVYQGPHPDLIMACRVMDPTVPPVDPTPAIQKALLDCALCCNFGAETPEWAKEPLKLVCSPATESGVANRRFIPMNGTDVVWNMYE